MTGPPSVMPLGSPYQVIGGPALVLAPGAAVTVRLRFANPLGRRIRYTPLVLAGTGTL